MAEGVQCPSMRWGTGDDQSALDEFKARLNRWFIIKGVEKAKQYDFIIFQAGEKGEEVAKTWTLQEEDMKDPLKVWQALEQSIGAADNFRVHRLNMTSYRQKETESIDEFYVRCRALALKCRFKDVDERLIDQLIVGTRCNESRRELLKADDKMTTETALILCRTQEASEEHMKAFEQSHREKSSGEKSNSDKLSVDVVRRKPYIKNCTYCGQDHPHGRCPAYNDTCEYCKKNGHWQQCCLQKQAAQNNVQKKKAQGNQMEHKLERRSKHKGQKKYVQKSMHGIEHYVETSDQSDADTRSFDKINKQHDGKEDQKERRAGR